MPKPNHQPVQSAALKLPPNTALAALVLDLDAEGKDYPEGCNAQVFPDGKFRSDDGRPASLTNGELRDWLMSAAVAAALIAALESSGKPILYDYEHRSVFYGDSRAAGWIDKLVYAEGRGLFAHVEWTPAAKAQIESKEFRYSSPYFYFSTQTGAITELVSVALTNTPGLPQLGSVGLTQVFNTPEESDMPGTTDVAALTTERDSLKTQVAALTTERDTLKKKVDDLEKAQTDAALAAEKAETTALIEAALKDGRLKLPEKPIVEKMGKALLTEFLATRTPGAALSRQADPHQTGTAALTAEDKEMARRMGVSEKDFLVARAQINGQPVVDDGGE